MNALKVVALVALLLASIPVGIVTMIFGWGLSAENWGWIAFGYAWAILVPIVSGALKP